MRRLREEGEARYMEFQHIFDLSHAAELDYDWVVLKLTVPETDSQWVRAPNA